MKCAVVGGANIDIGGFPGAAAVMEDSNPGRVVRSAGGVGRNIACTLARLNVDTRLVTALGSDAFARVIRDDCRDAGVDLSSALTFDANSNVYLYIADSAGDLRLAVSDMALCGRLTPEALEAQLPMLNAMDAVVLDANLPKETLAWLAGQVHVPLIADAVSTAKALRLIPALPRLHALKPNELEAEALAGIPVTDPASAGAAARRLLDLGVQQVFVTLGKQGVLCADARTSRFIPGPPVRLVNATGAGDAFTAALAWAQMRGMDLVESTRAGIAAASLTVESPEAVSRSITPQVIEQRMQSL